ncbi:MAG: response regulator transcription factor [Candidatus Marinimicrobia bacterium]|nr:response regulator transcription factor [Candidatus Neomarinimicrobiota bacterium]MCF7828203.1 response regulator transcription factor [Candidatus Neomarinimicrobiota bacterium]MCF7879622.1 response regulator transcription factor [Candidatus Neomarinimicrobiota bacterium]
MFKIFVADDHDLIREGFKNVINSEMDMEVVGEAKNAGDVIDFLHHQDCDVVVLDITMPGRSGLDVLKEIQSLDTRAKVLILSMHPEDRFAIRTLKAGAAGYITKEKAPDELVKAIRKVVAGGKYVSESLAENLIDALSGQDKGPPHIQLSDREYEVFELIAQGISTSNIAEKLSLSQSTINTYRIRVLDKLNMKNNAEIVKYAVNHGLIE